MRNGHVNTDYIDREEANETAALIALASVDHEITCGEVRRIIEDIPSADVQPVVRCADCKWMQYNMRGDGYLPNGVPEYECRHWCGPCDPTDFCSYGARMDGE